MWINPRGSTLAIEPMREEARGRVRAALGERGWTAAELSREARVDMGTVGDFLNGNRWPQVSTQRKIDLALGWIPGTINSIARGEPAPTTAETVGDEDQDAGVLLSLPPEALEGLDAIDREEVIAAARLSALQAAREIRRRLDQ